MTSVLIAGGHHSLLECLLVAQMMGYFQNLPNVSAGTDEPAPAYYTGIAKAMEEYLAELGLEPAGSSTIFGHSPPLGAMHSESPLRRPRLATTSSNGSFMSANNESIEFFRLPAAHGGDESHRRDAADEHVSSEDGGRHQAPSSTAAAVAACAGG